jgi:transposase-like protein
MFDVFNLGWPEGAEEALIITTLSGETELLGCPKCNSKLVKISPDIAYCKSCNVKYKYRSGN